MACSICKLDERTVEEVNRRLRAEFSFKDITAWLRETHPVISNQAVECHWGRVRRAVKCPGPTD